MARSGMYADLMLIKTRPCRRGNSDSDSNEDEEIEEGAGNRQAGLLSLPSI